ncbi:HD domain-containing protein [Marinomonas sp. M1K-6]|uniref:HD domain-containing protein n=1 Tax=Marinomonas profundi TaxID=2726122 RepID=A0A847R323_9GAMM|nr:HD domain-containing protein [Marinomonas profundi]NLQ18252.1 HD domain-containing protein [Marinomonas profundi]UDV03603.1 HD domain-containing protein [Marinomonas profundi]
MSDWLAKYEAQFYAFLDAQEYVDVAHDLAHIARVVKVAKQLALEENADLAVVLPAAYLHDCVSLPKNHPERHLASTLAADKAIGFLASIDYPDEYHHAIHHAIRAHSFSANITPESLEARIVQDADRLDALGAIGIARCMQVSGALNRALYSLDDPFCEVRETDDRRYSIDHFYHKLFRIANSLNTASARREGKKREGIMRDFLAQLRVEIVPR